MKIRTTSRHRFRALRHRRPVSSWLAVCAAAAFALAAGCTSSERPVPVLASDAAAGNQLAGSEWRPVDIAGVEIAADSELFVHFGGDGSVSGNGGCNRFAGGYKPATDKIEIGPLAATMMACPEPVMDQEARFLEMLAQAKRFARNGTDLAMFDDAGNEIGRLVQTDAD